MLFLLVQLSKTYPQIQDLTIDPASRPDPEEDEGEEAAEKRVYDSRKRDPKFANADKSSLWETRQFLNHYHPSVNVYAEALINGTEQVKPDLGLFTLTHFLDRFVYKNAKQKVNAKGSSIMQPLGGSHTGSLIVRATNLKSTELPVNTEAWLSKKLEDVQADEKFFHLYFKSKKNKVVSETSHKETANEDDEGLDDDEVWKALVKSKPDVEASDDDGFADFDAEDFSASREA